MDEFFSYIYSAKLPNRWMDFSADYWLYTHWKFIVSKNNPWNWAIHLVNILSLYCERWQRWRHSHQEQPEELPSCFRNLDSGKTGSLAFIQKIILRWASMKHNQVFIKTHSFQAGVNPEFEAGGKSPAQPFPFSSLPPPCKSTTLVLFYPSISAT